MEKELIILFYCIYFLLIQGCNSIEKKENSHNNIIAKKEKIPITENSVDSESLGLISYLKKDTSINIKEIELGDKYVDSNVIYYKSFFTYRAYRQKYDKDTFAIVQTLRMEMLEKTLNRYIYIDIWRFIDSSQCKIFYDDFEKIGFSSFVYAEKRSVMALKYCNYIIFFQIVHDKADDKLKYLINKIKSKGYFRENCL